MSIKRGRGVVGRQIKRPFEVNLLFIITVAAETILCSSSLLNITRSGGSHLWIKILFYFPCINIFYLCLRNGRGFNRGKAWLAWWTTPKSNYFWTSFLLYEFGFCNGKSSVLEELRSTPDWETLACAWFFFLWIGEEVRAFLSIITDRRCRSSRCSASFFFKLVICVVASSSSSLYISTLSKGANWRIPNNRSIELLILIFFLF